MLLRTVPLLLVLASVACAVAYMRRLDQSVSIATRGFVDGPSEVGTTAWRTVPTTESVEIRREPMGAQREARTARPSRARAEQLHSHVLRETAIRDIPMFGQLAALYIGIFAMPVLAVTLVLLKRYAQDSLRLREDEMIHPARDA
jgi:hypothetical protein